MSSITELIKELREKTGAGFLDCKKSLENNNNDIDKSIEELRKKGLAKASKKSDRAAIEGAVGFYTNENITALIKVNSETDFAAKSDTFLDFLDNLGKIVLENKININKEQFLKLQFEKGTVQDYFNSMIAKIGENLILNDLLIKENTNSNYSFYIHNSYRKNIGKIISLLEYSTTDNNPEIEALSKNLCMHIAAMKPESMDVNDLDKNLISNEEKIQKELILNSGKPSNIVEKILEGKMKKYFSEVTLLNQPYILDQDKNVRDIIKQYSKYEYSLISFNLINL
ncbi:translation elongation factor Ts [Pelagibacteraceae bacterium]|nr:translation elongation factor Ts [Pelagibacteraceae bacterium]